MRAMLTIKEKLGVLIGYSDHTLGLTVPVMAVSLGARVIEKHLTLSQKMSGPDHAASLEPSEFGQMVSMIREAEAALGSGLKVPTREEKIFQKDDRKSLVTSIYIPKGTVISPKNICIKRPGMGLPPKLFGKVLGRRARKDLEKDYLLKWSDLVTV